jgi:hypothetical protein
MLITARAQVQRGYQQHQPVHSPTSPVHGPTTSLNATALSYWHACKATSTCSPSPHVTLRLRLPLQGLSRYKPSANPLLLPMHRATPMKCHS